jgi:hypothetical protein
VFILPLERFIPLAEILRRILKDPHRPAHRKHSISMPRALYLFVRAQWIYLVTLALASAILYGSFIWSLTIKQGWRDCPELYLDQDISLYLGMIKHASMHPEGGDFYIKNSPVYPSLYEKCGFTVQVLGWIVKHCGMNALFLLLFPLWILWIFSVWKLLLEFELPPGPSLLASFLLPYAISMTGVYYGTRHFWWFTTFPWEDYWRLYPSLISASLYSVAILLVVRWIRTGTAVKKSSLLIFTGVICGLVVYGRPFDWIVLGSFIMLLCIWFYRKQERNLCYNLIKIGLIALVVASPYLISYLAFSLSYKEAFEDTMSRHNMQFMSIGHYARYTFFILLVCISLLGIRWIINKFAADKLTHRNWMILFLLLLASSIGYFSTLPSRKTLVGAFYFTTWNIVPAYYLASCALGLRATNKYLSRLSPVFWSFIILTLASGSALWCHSKALKTQTRDFTENGVFAFKSCLDTIKSLETSPSQVTVMTTSHGNLVNAELGCHLYLVTNANQTPFAPTTELFRRFLLMMHSIKGNFGFLPEIVESNGMTLESLRSLMDPSDLRWFQLLGAAIGRNNISIHANKDKPELAARHLELPPHLRDLDEQVVYLTPFLKPIFEEVQAQVTKGPSTPDLLMGSDIDYILIRTDYFGHPPKHSRWKLLKSAPPYQLFTIQTPKITTSPKPQAPSFQQ